MDLRDRTLIALGGQLGHPHGLPGRVVGRFLNHANRAAILAAVDALDIPPAPVLADLGFGGGIGLEILLSRVGAGGRVHGVDVSSTMIDAASRRFSREIEAGLLKVHCAPIERLPLETSTVDGVITLNTFYFISDLDSALRECTRVLRPSGQLVIGLGDPDQMARQPMTDHGFRLRPLSEIRKALVLAGLEVDRHLQVGSGHDVTNLLVTQPL